MNEQECFIALNMAAGLGPLKIKRLLDCFLSAEAVFKAPRQKVAEVLRSDSAVVEQVQSIILSREFNDEMQRIREHGIQILTIVDEAYPYALKQIYDPPPVLYVAGNCDFFRKTTVALVGCRRASFSGMQQAERLARALSSRGVCVVSGLARGIDTAAHRGALTGQGSTIAVLGSGLLHIYPPENKKLYAEIVRKGAVISEFPFCMNPLPINFPRRNRIISGLSRAIVVVEAARRSGSLITAGLALSQGREVYAMPGTANAVNTQGTNKLIKEGAKLVENADDVLEELLVEGEKMSREDRQDNLLGHGTGTFADRLLEILNEEPMHIDCLIRASNLDSACVYKNLLELQLKGMVKEIEGKRFVKKEGCYGT
ncbi:MAG: DNA-processing protein DprA [Candidatus Omnitrophica bacterium]|nr:DNA-processing protein DprA [Candidatus Omnitrophota bacterium]MBU4479272.1 DNA-processing protein DprA [Candidatus Omnitrophota bacterium]MCG2703253.1 DNA-processing protein DprA [Candidatus Omnitrophota bacterium]